MIEGDETVTSMSKIHYLERIIDNLQEHCLHWMEFLEPLGEGKRMLLGVLLNIDNHDNRLGTTKISIIDIYFSFRL